MAHQASIARKLASPHPLSGAPRPPGPKHVPTHVLDGHQSTHAPTVLHGGVPVPTWSTLFM